MGTRNLTVVIKNNQIKLSQYGQWDGYFRVTGKKFIDFVKSAHLGDFSKRIDLLKACDSAYITNTEKNFLEMQKNKEFFMPFLAAFSQFSRDTGVEILDIINKLDYNYCYNKKSYPVFIDTDSSWVEFIYILDLDIETVYLLTNHEFEGAKDTTKLIADNFKNFDCWFTSKIDDLPSVEEIQNLSDNLGL